MAAQSVLVADIGGTHARFAVAHIDADQISLSDIQDFETARFASLTAAAKAYLATVDVRPKIACFAVAAPVDQDPIEFTNSDWQFRLDELQSALAIEPIKIVNDFYAMAAGVACLPDAAFEIVKSGAGDPTAPLLVIGPGTGLGQALIVPTSAGMRIVSTQGGHVGFAPMNDEESEILKIMRRKHHRVSVERLLSGEGLVNIFAAYGNLAKVKQPALQPEEITEAARDGSSPDAKKAVALFFEILGRTAGDAVLSTGARGGVILAGGILPKNRDLLSKSKFVDGFLDKGRMRDYVDDVPVKLIVTGEAALSGAAHIATRLPASDFVSPTKAPSVDAR